MLFIKRMPRVSEIPNPGAVFSLSPNMQMTKPPGVDMLYKWVEKEISAGWEPVCNVVVLTNLKLHLCDIPSHLLKMNIYSNRRTTEGLKEALQEKTTDRVSGRTYVYVTVFSVIFDDPTDTS